MLTYLSRMQDVECIFVSRNTSGTNHGIRCLSFELRGGATRATHYCSRTFENAVWQCHAIYETCKREPDIRPDLIVGHSGFGTTAMLKELYDSRIINFFEYYYHPHQSDMDFRPDFPPEEIDFLRSRMRNAMILIDLETCDAGYSPTHWQKGLLPEVYQSKVAVIHDGIDTELWQKRPVKKRLGDEVIPDDVRIVTYVSRGFEAMRGFDIFIRIAKRISECMSDVLFVCVGSDRICYGNDRKHIRAKTLREHLFLTEKPAPERFRFLGVISPEALARVFSMSDLHIYLTVPFVLSWSLLNAMACECVVLGSDTAPVREFVRHGENGLLNDFFDVQGFADQAMDVLKYPEKFSHLGTRAREGIEAHYSLNKTFPKLWRFFREGCVNHE